MNTRAICWIIRPWKGKEKHYRINVISVITSYKLDFNGYKNHSLISSNCSFARAVSKKEVALGNWLNISRNCSSMGTSDAWESETLLLPLFLYCGTLTWPFFSFSLGLLLVLQGEGGLTSVSPLANPGSFSSLLKTVWPHTSHGSRYPPLIRHAL